MITDFINRFRSRSKAENIVWRVDPYEGLDFVFSQTALSSPEEMAMDDPIFGMKYAYLKSLYEQGYAEKNATGYTIKSDLVPGLEEDFFELFQLPSLFGGKYVSRIKGNSAQAAFKVDIDLVMPDGSSLTHYTIDGPFLKVAENESYRLTPEEWKALTAVRDHGQLSPDKKDEYENNWLIFQLQLSKKAGMNIDLSQFNNLELSQPESIGVALEELDNGDVAITPTYGPGFDVKEIQKRLGNLDVNKDHGIMRVGNRFALLDKDRIEATQEILTNRRIPKEQVKTFLDSPTAYLNAALIDLDTGFSLRVHGAERFSHKYFGDTEKSGVDWFGSTDKLLEPIGNLPPIVNSEDDFKEAAQRLQDAQLKGADTVEIQDREFDIRDPEKVTATVGEIKDRLEKSDSAELSERETAPEPQVQLEKAVVAVDANDEEASFVKEVSISKLQLEAENFRQENLKRTPFVHQDEGIRWLLAHLSSVKTEGAGAILADDMGLGKTFMTLVAIGEWLQRCKEKGKTEKPVMIVAPLSLLENWQAEVFDTFHKSPFRDIVVLQAGGDLKKFKVKGAKRETEQEFGEDDLISEFDQIRYSLKVGKNYGSDRLDMPTRLVLTTYQTLRDYQFSLSSIDWGVVAFDEAQNMKNPNALATRAAMGLKADFKLLATGTPVENSLKDFWCLMDIAVPGYLGAWQEFRAEYISPILSADVDAIKDVKLDVGRRLRQRVGDFMLRRTKAEKLDGIPKKTIFTGDQVDKENFLPTLAGLMNGSQLKTYDEIIDDVKNSPIEDKRGVVLPSLHRLKIVSIHPDLLPHGEVSDASSNLVKSAKQSSKILSLIQILEEIKKRNEKVLIFATTKAVQAYVAALVTSMYRTEVNIINGETKAVATKRDMETRKGIIDKFQENDGFGVLIMSPVAAGVGLTVTGANNVIHLERHWNPAKEAQATDRVYRIGQKRPVNVYLPMALHPNLTSFDLHLNKLLENKVDLSDAVVAATAVDSNDMAGLF